MSAKKYVGLDVHTATTGIAIRDGRGNLVAETTLKTEAGVIGDDVRGLSGQVHVTFDEGAQADWLFDLLSPLVHRVLVCNPSENRSGASKTKSDKIDARRLSEWLDKGTLKAVYHGERSTRALRRLGRAHEAYAALASIPGLGPVRVAAVISAMKTPHRFRRNRQLWAYAALAIETTAGGRAAGGLPPPSGTLRPYAARASSPADGGLDPSPEQLSEPAPEMPPGAR